MEKVCGIYEIRNIVNGHIYIGSSKNVNSRIYGHFKELNCGKHGNLYLQRAFDKYGKDSFEGKLLIICNIDMLIFYEQMFIDAWKPGYNISSIAGRPDMTDDVKYKISLANTGRIFSDDTRHNMSIAKVGNQYCKGRINSDYTRKKMSVSATGKKHSDEHNRNMGLSKKGNQYWKGRHHSEESREKISSTLKGRELPEETKKKISGSLKGNQHTKGYKHTDETKRKISNALKGNQTWIGRKHSEESKHKMSLARKSYWEVKRSK